MKARGLIIFFVPLLLIGCNGNGKKESVRTVKTINPVPVESTITRRLPGIVKENQIVNLGFKTAGQIEKIYVKEGDYVREGQLIAQLDDDDYKLQLSATQIQYNQLKTEVERLGELYKRKSISGNDYDKAQAGLKAMEVQLRANENTIAYTKLKAPTSGYIQAINFRPAEMVDAGMAIVSLIDVSRMIIETDLPIYLYLQRNKFGNIAGRSYALPDSEFSLELLSINHKSSGNQLYKMQLTPQSAFRGQLTAGMNVEVLIETREKESLVQDLKLPSSCIFTENDKSYVWVFSTSQSVVNKREVQVKGIDVDGMLLVSGVNTLDNIVSAGIHFLQENEKVNLVQEVSDTNVGGLL
jgi:RND family efflux transporter MFP subunit